MINRESYITDQSLLIDVDFNAKKIKGLTKITLSELDKSLFEQEIPLKINLCAKQIDIKKVRLGEIDLKLSQDQSKNLKYPITHDLFIVNWSYPELINQANQMRKLTNNIRSIASWLKYIRLNQEIENNGLLSLEITRLTKNPSLKAGEIEIKWLDIEKIRITIVIDYELYQPISGLRFHTDHQNFNYLVSDNSIGSTRYWLPCLDSLHQQTFISKIKVIIPSEYTVICSGNAINQLIDPDENKSLYEFEIKKKLSIYDIGLCIGKFEYLTIEKENYIFYCFFNEKMKNQINSIFSNTNLLDLMNDFEKNCLKKTESIQPYKYVFLPYINGKKSLKEVPNAYYDMCIIDEYAISDHKILDCQNRKKPLIYIFRSFCWSSLNELKIYTMNEIWIKIGLVFFLTDLFYSLLSTEVENRMYISKKFDKLCLLIENGREVFPLSSPQFSHESEVFYNRAWILRANLVFQMLSTLITIENTKRLIKMLVNAENTITNQYFFKMIKSSFGIKTIKYFKNQFIKQSGSIKEIGYSCPAFHSEHTYFRKENKIDLILVQKPLQEQYYKELTEARIILEKHFNFENEYTKILSKLNEENMNFWDKHKFINAKTKSCKIFYGKLNIMSTETNEVEFKEEIFRVFFEKKKENKITINCRRKFKKTIQKKQNDVDEDSTERALSNITYQEAKKKIHQSMAQNTARNPALWIDIDPDNMYLKKIVDNKSDNSWAAVLNNEKKLSDIFLALKGLQNGDPSISQNLLIFFLDIPQMPFDIKLKIFNVMHPRNSDLKGMLDFRNKTQEYLIKDILRDIAKFSERNNAMDEIMGPTIEHPTNPLVIKIILTLIKENQETNNFIDDCIHISQLLGLLLQTKNTCFTKKILKECSRALQLEKIKMSANQIILSKIIKNFNKFCENHNIIHKNSIEDEKIKTLLIQVRKLTKSFPILYPIDPSIGSLVFAYSIEKKMLKKRKIWVILIKALKEISRYQTEQKFFIAESLIEVLYEFVSKNRSDFYHMQRLITEESNKKIVDTLWEILNQAICGVSIKIRHYYYLIYREIYYDMVPICYAKEFPEQVELDMNWFDFEANRPQSKEVVKDRKFLQFKHLSLQKRKRSTLDKNRVNARELLWSHFRHHPDLELDWKKLAKQILNVLMAEKITENIEKKLNEEVNTEEIEGGDGFVIKIKNTFNLKVIKKKLIKGSYLNMEDFEKDLFQVIQSYKKKKMIDDETKDEYEVLLMNLFKEANNILKDYKRREDEKFKNLKIFIKGNVVQKLLESKDNLRLSMEKIFFSIKISGISFDRFDA